MEFSQFSELPVQFFYDHFGFHQVLIVAFAEGLTKSGGV
jgi:hypothetical protein